MKMSGRLAVVLIVLSSMLMAGGHAPGQQAPEAEFSKGVEVGKAPVIIAATIVCGSLERDYTFEPQFYGKVSGDAPIRASHPPVVLYTSVLTPGFFRLASALDALIAKDRTWSNSMVIVSDEKGAQLGGYTVEEVTQRRIALRQLVLHNGITHLSFFLSAPPAKTLMKRLELTGKQDLLLAVLDNRGKRKVDAPVLSVQRLESDKLSEDACKKIVASLTPH